MIMNKPDQNTLQMYPKNKDFDFFQNSAINTFLEETC